MKGKELLLIAVSSFILTVIWIVSNVYHAYATSTIDTLLQIQILPIAPSFDMTTIDKLKKRQVIEPSTGSSLAPSPTPGLSPTPEAELQIEPLPLAESENPSITPTQVEEIVVASITPTP